jgi:hypothetical protein
VLDLSLVSPAATISRAEEAAAEGVVVNAGSEPEEVDLVVISSPSLALEIVDERGTPLRMLPPPTPGRAETIVLAPGERRTIPFHGFLPPSVARGRYRVRLRYGAARSEWIAIAIG